MLRSYVLFLIVTMLLSTYPRAFAVDEAPEKIIYDGNGIPLVYYIGHGYQRNPVTTSFALDYYHANYLQTKNQTNYKYMVNTANWLVANAKVRGNFSLLEYDFDFSYNMTSPWRSAMANGLAMQSLVEAYQLTRNSTYLETTDKLLNAFFIDIKDGGITDKTENQGWWFEEYADEGGTNPKVLNGMMYTLLALDDYYLFSKDLRALYLFKQGTLSLRNNLPLYDSGYNSYFSVSELSNQFYNQLHIDLLDRLFKITHDPIFKQYRDQFECYKHVGECKQITLPTANNQLAPKESRHTATLSNEMSIPNMISYINVISLLGGIGLILLRVRKKRQL